MSGSHCVSTSKILWLLIRTTLAKVLLEIQWCIISNFTWSSQFHLDSYSNFSSTWLYPKNFHHRMRNSDSPAPKYSELLVSHRSNLRSEGHIYPYPIRATLDGKVLQKWSRSVKYTPTNHPYFIFVSRHVLVKRTTN